MAEVQTPVDLRTIIVGNAFQGREYRPSPSPYAKSPNTAVMERPESTITTVVSPNIVRKDAKALTMPGVLPSDASHETVSVPRRRTILSLSNERTLTVARVSAVQNHSDETAGQRPHGNNGPDRPHEKGPPTAGGGGEPPDNIEPPPRPTGGEADDGDEHNERSPEVAMERARWLRVISHLPGMDTEQFVQILEAKNRVDAGKDPFPQAATGPVAPRDESSPVVLTFPSSDEDPHIHQTQEQVYAILQERLAEMDAVVQTSLENYDTAYEAYNTATDEPSRAAAVRRIIDAADQYTRTVTTVTFIQAMKNIPGATPHIQLESLEAYDRFDNYEVAETGAASTAPADTFESIVFQPADPDAEWNARAAEGNTIADRLFANVNETGSELDTAFNLFPNEELKRLMLAHIENVRRHERAKQATFILNALAKHPRIAPISGLQVMNFIDIERQKFADDNGPDSHS